MELIGPTAGRCRRTTFAAYVGEVRLEAPTESFVFPDSPASWKGEFGNNFPGGAEGKQFKGLPTQKGRSEGVIFTVHWIAQNGDPKEDKTILTSKGKEPA